MLSFLAASASLYKYTEKEATLFRGHYDISQDAGKVIVTIYMHSLVNLIKINNLSLTTKHSGRLVKGRDDINVSFKEIFKMIKVGD